MPARSTPAAQTDDPEHAAAASTSTTRHRDRRTADAFERRVAAAEEVAEHEMQLQEHARADGEPREAHVTAFRPDAPAAITVTVRTPGVARPTTSAARPRRSTVAPRAVEALGRQSDPRTEAFDDRVTRPARNQEQRDRAHAPRRPRARSPRPRAGSDRRRRVHPRAASRDRPAPGSARPPPSATSSPSDGGNAQTRCPRRDPSPPAILAAAPRCIGPHLLRAPCSPCRRTWTSAGPESTVAGASDRVPFPRSRV